MKILLSLLLLLVSDYSFSAGNSPFIINRTCTDGAYNIITQACNSSGGSGGVTTMGTFGSTPNANGGTISGTTLTLQPASNTQPGGVSKTDQTFAGNKTFNGSVTVESTFDVEDVSNFNSDVTIQDDLQVNINFEADGDSAFNSATFNGTVNVNALLVVSDMSSGSTQWDLSGELTINTDTNINLNSASNGITLTSNNGDPIVLNSTTGNIQFQSSGGANWSINSDGSASIGTSNNGVTVDYIIPTKIAINSPQSTVNCSTSGSVVYSQPEQGASYKKVVAYNSACLGTAAYTFPTGFSHTPNVISTNGPAATIVTSLSTSAMTITGATTTGFIFIEGF